MASLGTGPAELPPAQEPPPEPAVTEAQQWVEQATGRSFGDKDFRSGLENGILLCELLNVIKPGLVKKINRLPTPIAGLDNIILFLRGCKELGLKESQLFDPGDLQDTSNRATIKSTDYSRKLKNVLVTIYWLGKAANSCTSYSGAILNLKEFEGLLAQMRKETDDIESPKRSIRDSGYIDCWDSERSDSLSPPRHGRDDSFDSLDSFGSRSQQTPSPDVVLRGSSDGRGSDSESDLPHRRIPDVKKDDMSARRVSYGENKAFVPFNQYLPNKSNQTTYIPAPLRKKKAEREEYRKSWSTATSPLGGERPFSQSHPEPIKEEHNEVSLQCNVDGPMKEVSQMGPGGNTTNSQGDLPQNQDASMDRTPTRDQKEFPASEWGQDKAEELKKLKRLERIGIKVLPAAKRYSSQNQTPETHGATPTPADIILRKENTFLASYCGVGSDSEEEDEECKVPDIEKDDLATRRIRKNQTKTATLVHPLSLGLYTSQKGQKREDVRLPPQGGSSRSPALSSDDESKLPVHVCKLVPEATKEVPVAVQDDRQHRKAREPRKRPHPRQKFVHFGPVTQIDQQRWDTLSIAKHGPADEAEVECSSSQACSAAASSVVASGIHTTESKAEVLQYDPSKVTRSSSDEGCREVLSSLESQKQTLNLLSCQQKGREELEHLPDPIRDDMSMRKLGTFQKKPSSTAPRVSPASVHQEPQRSFPKMSLRTRLKEESSSVPLPGVAVHCRETPLPSSIISSSVLKEESPQVLIDQSQESNATEDALRVPDPEKDDMMTRRTGVYQKQSSPGLKHFLPVAFTKQEEDSAMGPTKTDEQVKSTTKSRSCMLDEHTRALSPVRPERALKSATHPQPSEAREEQRPEAGQDGQHSLRALISTQEQPSLNLIPPDPSVKEAPETTAQNEVLRFGPRTALSDDAESMSMFDMRCEDAAVMQPHSRVHQEQLQNVNSQLKEEDDQWQDDLARWKNRRRSASQDLIKKEQERKKMEKVLSGEDALCERRKSIKTYKEIVEEKERREKELHEAYKNAKSREEAEKILNKYIERFTISEAVLEHLQMPNALERRHSVEPNLLSVPMDPNPMKYLRQQSLPAPKFTATVEAAVVASSESDTRFSTGRTSPTKTAVSKAVPLLVPKPYSQPKTTAVLKTFKVDSNVSMNGEAFSGMVDENEDKCATVVFAPSLGRSQMFEGVARVDGSPEELARVDRSPEELKQESTRIELNLRRPISRSVCKDVMDSPVEKMKSANQKEETNSAGCAERTYSGPVSPEVSGLKQPQQTMTKSSITARTSMEHTPPNHRSEPAAADKGLSPAERDPPRDILIKQKAVKSETNELEEYAVFQFFKKAPEVSRVPCQNVSHQVDSSTCEKSPVLVPSQNSAKRVNFWSWDPEEERKRQEKWQQDQEQLLQERYQKEQEKLKEEWEKAQQEVEEEERKYYEEERKIIEDTVVPVTVSSSSTEPFSSCSSASLPEENKKSGSLVRSVPELKHTQEVAENQTCITGKVNDDVEEKQPKAENEKHTLLWDQDAESLVNNDRGKLGQEEKSRKKVTPGYPETVTLSRREQGSQAPTEEHSSPARMQLPLLDAPRTPQLLLQGAPVSQDLSLKPPALNLSPSLQNHTSGGLRRTGSHENIKDGLSSPCSPTPQCHSPSRSVSGKKLCSSCGLPLGKGAAMIIETLNLFFHIHCFRCAICKGQLGDTTTGTDVRIRNGLLNCNDCYIRSRTAGQPTTL